MNARQQRNICKAVFNGNLTYLEQTTDEDVADVVHLRLASKKHGLSYRTTLAHFACLHGNFPAVRLLVSLGSRQFETLDDLGHLPVHYAIAMQRTDIVEFLVNRDPMCKKNAETVFHLTTSTMILGLQDSMGKLPVYSSRRRVRRALTALQTSF